MKGITLDTSPWDGPYVKSYQNLVKANNVVLTLACVLIGSTAFAIISYHFQCLVHNTPFLFSMCLKVILVNVIVGILLWGLKSLVACGAFKAVTGQYGTLPMFMTVEGMSDIVFLAFIPIYIIMLIFNCGGLAIGAAIATKYFIMYNSYPALLGRQITSLDRITAIIASIGTLVIIRGVIFLLWGN